MKNVYKLPENAKEEPTLREEAELMLCVVQLLLLKMICKQIGINRIHNIYTHSF